MALKITDPVWFDHNTIDVKWDHPTLSERYGVLNYTVTDDSGEPEMQAIWDDLLDGVYGPIEGERPDPVEVA